MRKLAIILGFVAVGGGWYALGGLETALGSDPIKFEAMSVLFTGMAFVGMLGALILQSKELTLQRQELQETREVLRETKEETNRFAVASERNAIIQEHYLVLSTVESLIKMYDRELLEWQEKMAEARAVIGDKKALGEDIQELAIRYEVMKETEDFHFKMLDRYAEVRLGVWSKFEDDFFSKYCSNLSQE